jgi:S1-C subfamily serine protease
MLMAITRGQDRFTANGTTDGHDAMHRTTAAICALLLAAAMLLIPTADLSAGVYKYQDENGVWHFTDTPDEEAYEAAEQYIKDNPKAAGKAAAGLTEPVGQDLQAHFQKNLPPANKIEEARNATVSIKMALGSGSGFFISDTGYIVTNRHVIDSSYGQDVDVADQIEAFKAQVEYQARVLDEEERQLRKQKAQLRRQRRQMSPEEYRHWKDELDRREEILRQRRYQFEQQRQQFEEAYDEYENRLINDLAQSGYTIVLADQTELQAEKVTVSERYDLALLRLKGYKTPFIPRGNAYGLHHGQPLYAIGNSLDMGHTVTSGIFSGRRADLLQTNAQINPGNSGGPLITEGGQVIGVNTSKVVGMGVEGVGFAIPINVVLAEFGAYIGP